MVAVLDTGPGPGADGGAHMFEAYYTSKPDGMGLGLRISQSLVEAHGGKLWVEENNHGGATFRFTLPLSDQGGSHG